MEGSQADMRLPQKRKKSFLDIIQPYLFLIPVYALMLTFKYIPFFNAVIKSFYKWNGGNVNQFIGFKNYTDLFGNKQFAISLKNSLIICLANVAIGLTLPLLAAELLYAIRSNRVQYITRTLLTFPMVVPSVVIILLWKWILAGDTGVLNSVLETIGLGALKSPWLGSSKTARFSVILVGFPWVSGLNFLLYYGALQGTPRELLEAATIDGANIVQRFFRVDIPLLLSQIKLVTTLAIINGIQVFETIFILTSGGPGTATMVPSILLYNSAFSFKKYGYSSAIGVVMFIIIMIITVINQKILKNTESAE